MTERQLSIVYQEGSDWGELPDSHQGLILSAIRASGKAYAPYSNFQVGAALLTNRGVVITGNNQENAAYPMCNCAEQVAIQKALSDDPSLSIVLFAIYANNGRTDLLAAPCGACRQVMCETANRTEKDFPVILVGADRSYRIFKTTNGFACLLGLGELIWFNDLST